ncbi:MAG TPA: aminotransferase class I/II-fold pyridoxal phosphate-dependent enzyme [Candidatus Latescibacteria bacterium]|jgi:glycine C-acetyltransferase|nr:aminotransferase class I/II-fold pyridoxal phosphate-dependent enzyme [Candidatus Latescibacterota bacterium]HJP29910.1 aminotransferase class I/II-fold pyridoxal phosphate-dependent enzyme [Candidatus Latescibacterota bacterium]
MQDAHRYSLEDFYFSDSADVLVPPEDFDTWLADPTIRQSFSFFEQPLLGKPDATTEIVSHIDGQRRRVINLTSYNYLGLSTHPEVLQAAREALDQYGLGAAGAAVLSGTYDLHVEFARRLAAFKQQEDCLLFSGGLAGNYGAIQGILRRGDVLLLDEKSHQSLIDGGTLSRAKVAFFKHNDAESLAEALEAHRGKRTLVVVEGVYSMDGDLADLPAIVDVCAAFDASVYIDEAHSTLMFGENGRGVAEHFGLEDKMGVTFGTLSKSFGGVGGFVCANRGLIRYMKAYSTPYIFSCACSPPVIGGCMKALEIATRDTTLRDRLWANVDVFRSQLAAMRLNLGQSASQVIPIIIGSSAETLYTMAAQLQCRGVFLQPIDYPAVPAETRRFRLSVNAQLSRAEIDEACNIIEDVVARGLRQ